MITHFIQLTASKHRQPSALHWPRSRRGCRTSSQLPGPCTQCKRARTHTHTHTQECNHTHVMLHCLLCQGQRLDLCSQHIELSVFPVSYPYKVLYSRQRSDVVMACEQLLADPYQHPLWQECFLPVA